VTAKYRQHVPRPAGARRSGPASWLAVPPEDRLRISVDRVRAAFSTAPNFSHVGAIDAAVLIPILDLDGEATILLIRRADNVLDSDSGHMAFPGGHLDPGEEPIAAALREAYEEIGLEPTTVEVIGTFGVLGRRHLIERILPVVGLVEGRPRLSADPAEVAAVIEVPIAVLASDAASWQELWGPDEHGEEMTFFAGVPELGEDLVWGLSARILALFLSRLFSPREPTPE
jgi:8-oxo-dGTP pyrophosphatase MutT (NUDIX family)